ncbi:MAG TPA: DUF2243 domain-containing protein [Terriglobales bacterium]|nr:DUF2243 domain-containing protein [Terriglobales bacterium]
MRNGTASGITFGIALGGFLDGILLHSILQWHHMISNVVAPTDMHGMSVNMLADGLFDAFCWLLTVAAVILLYREARRASLPRARVYVGWIVFGAGFFNLLEGLIDHELLRIHHVRPTPSWLAWDLGFLAIAGVLFMVVGWLLTRGPRRSGNVQSIRAA